MLITTIYEDFAKSAAEATSKLLKLACGVGFNSFAVPNDFEIRRFMVKVRYYGHNSRRRQMLRAIDIAERNRKKELS